MIFPVRNSHKGGPILESLVKYREVRPDSSCSIKLEQFNRISVLLTLEVNLIKPELVQSVEI